MSAPKPHRLSGSAAGFDDAQFTAFARLHPDLRIERDSTGKLIVMPPTGWNAGKRNANLTMQLAQWARTDGDGVAADSSTGFKLPNGAIRSPDAAWVTNERLATLSPAELDGFPPLCPDFVVELRSPGDTLEELHAKMREYIANGARLGWLIDPDSRTVFVYRPQRRVGVRKNVARLAADPELPGFTLDLTDIWD